MPWLEELKIWFAGNARTNCGSWLSSTPRMTPAPGRTSVSRTICATRLLRCVAISRRGSRSTSTSRRSRTSTRRTLAPW